MPNMPRAAYLIHRLGHVGPARSANIVAIWKWVRFFVDALPDVAINAPWPSYAMALDETNYRARGIRDGKVLALADVNDIGIVCGPELSAGCQIDRDNMIEAGRGILDMTPLGLYSPPSGDVARDRVLQAVAAVFSRMPKGYSNHGPLAFLEHAAGEVRLRFDGDEGP